MTNRTRSNRCLRFFTAFSFITTLLAGVLAPSTVSASTKQTPANTAEGQHVTLTVWRGACQGDKNAICIQRVSEEGKRVEEQPRALAPSTEDSGKPVVVFDGTYFVVVYQADGELVSTWLDPRSGKELVTYTIVGNVQLRKPKLGLVDGAVVVVWQQKHKDGWKDHGGHLSFFSGIIEA